MAQLMTRFVTRVDRGILLLLLLPWLLLLVNDVWLFDLHLYIDPWLYLGFFLRLPQFLASFGGDTYYATRLPLLLPGHLAFTLLPPLVAQYVLHLSFYYAAVLSIYGVLKTLLSHRVAVLTSVMLGCYAWFLWAISSNYPESAGIAYSSVTIAMVMQAARSPRWRQFALLSGIFWALTIFTNLTWISLTPPLLWLYWDVNRRTHQRPFGPSFAIACLGIVITTGLLGLINVAFNQRFLFFLPSLNAASQLLFVLNSPWHGNLIEILPNAAWLMWLTCTTVGSLALLSRSRWQKTPSISPPSFGLHLFFLLSALIFFLLEVGRVSTLQYHWYTSYLIPATFLGVGAQLAQLDSALDRLPPSRFWLLPGSVILLTLVALRLPPALDVGRQQVVWLTLGLSALWWLWTLYGIWQPQQSQTVQRGLIVTVLLTFGAVNLISLVGLNRVSYIHHLTAASLKWEPIRVDEPRVQVNLTQHRDAFVATVTVQQWLRELDPELKSLFWYDLQEAFVYRSIAAASFWQTLSETFPQTGLAGAAPAQVKQTQALLNSKSEIIVLSQKSDALPQAQATLAQLGYPTQLIETRSLEQGAIRFNLIRLRLRPTAQSLQVEG